MKTIETKNAPAAIGPYSQAKVANGFVYASGQVPLDPATGEVVGTTIEEQTEQIMKNIGAILEAAGVTYENVSKPPVSWRKWQISQLLMQFMINILPENRPAPVWL